ncbi:hypothetical protein O3M35_006155 [Rhynocoris fuscipes]|uniref:Nuclear pore complex protein Nup88 n=1 Tax=Rhynocoris fuscipes TaxID=488301 RepID=A0AAW1DET2_9HEMI
MDFSTITNHNIFQNLKSRHFSGTLKCLELMDCEQDFLFIWDNHESSIRCLNVKHCLRDNDFKSEVLLIPSLGISFEVERIKANLSCSFICLSGTHGVAVVTLPDSMPKEDKFHVPFRSLSERLYLGELHECRKAKWYPGSPTDTHLVTLSSDECLRCYDAHNGNIIWKCLLSKRTIYPPHSSMPSKISLGDTPVDFDFAPPINSEKKGTEWPVLVLWGNGDVYCVWTKLSQAKATISGPLRMFPSSDDNYGSDASSILVTGSRPPLVVLATSIGTLYHCLLVSSEEADSRLDKSLLVVESVELDIGYSISEQDEIPSASQIILYKDPVDVARYFCIHMAGVHSVIVPLVSKLHHLEDDDSDIGSYKEESIVDYLLCTNISGGVSNNLSELLVPLGCTLINLSRNLFVLVGDELCNIQLIPRMLYSMAPEAQMKGLQSSSSPEGFLLLIERTLRENSASGCPLMKLGNGTSPSEWFEVFNRTITYLYSVVKTQKSVAIKLDAKASELNITLSSLKNDISTLLKDKADLKESAERIADSYEELKERQATLMKTLERVMMKTYSKKPGLSGKEKAALDNLNSIEKRMERYEKDIERLKSNLNYYKSVCKDNSQDIRPKNSFFDEPRAQIIRKQLSSLMTDIGEITRRVKIMKLSMDEAGIPAKI